MQRYGIRINGDELEVFKSDEGAFVSYDYAHRLEVALQDAEVIFKDIAARRGSSFTSQRVATDAEQGLEIIHEALSASTEEGWR